MARSWILPALLGVVLGLVAGRFWAEREYVRPAGVTDRAEDEGARSEVPDAERVVPLGGSEKLVAAERRIADLEEQLLRVQAEKNKLAEDLRRRSGAAIDQILTQLDELRKAPPLSVFIPGKTADLIAALKELGPEGTKALTDLLKSENAQDRVIAAKLLEELKDPAAIPALREAALNDDDPLAARMASHALALMEDKAAIGPLRDVLEQHRSWESDVNALWGLVNLGDADALGQATAYMANKDVSQQARAALGANVAAVMHRPEVMPIVDATVKDFYKSDEVMTIAIGYYKAVGTPEARARLQAIVDDSKYSQTIRTAAQEALF